MIQPPPPDLRRLDAEAIRVLRENAAEFAAFVSRAREKGDAACGSHPVTAMLAEAVALSRGEIFTSRDKPAQCADAFAAHLVWLSEAPLLPGRGYLLKAGAQTTSAAITELKYRLNVDTSEHLAAKDLHRDEIAFANIATAEPIGFDPYDENEETGAFILIDRHTDATVAAGLIRFGLRRAANTHFQSFEVSKTARAFEKTQAGAPLVHGIVGRWKIDDCRSSGPEVARHRQTYFCARRR